MEEKRDLDPAGMAILIAIMVLLAVNQVAIKVTNAGFAPVFAAGLRSAGGLAVLALWMRLRGIGWEFSRATAGAGLLAGLFFAGEFILLFVALDLSTVTRVSVIFYTMPVWMALAGHFLLPGERLDLRKLAGLALAVGGVAWAITARSDSHGTASLWGDLAALGAALGWMAVSLFARITPLARLVPEMQMAWQLLVSAPVLLLLAPLFGPLIRDLKPIHFAGLAFQAVVVAGGVFLVWFCLLKRYKAQGVASFAFLPPVFGVFLGWSLLGEAVDLPLIGALVLVAGGIALVNRRARG